MRKRIEFSKWTVLMMSSAKQPVIQFQLPKITVYCGLIIILCFTSLLAFSYSSMVSLADANEQLIQALEKRGVEMEVLQRKNQVLKEDAAEIYQKVNELRRLETMIKEISTALEPLLDNLGSARKPMGGIEVGLKDSDHRAQPAAIMSHHQAVSSEIMYATLKSQLPDLVKQYEEATEHILNLKRQLAISPIIVPTSEERITSLFGSRKDPFTRRTAFHTGIDFAGNLDSPIYAAADGTVTLARMDGGYGKSVMIRHSSKYRTRYAHLSRIEVSEGEQVKQGDILGYMGNTGRSTGVHLHYEVIKDGKPVDPSPYLIYKKEWKGD